MGVVGLSMPAAVQRRGSLHGGSGGRLSAASTVDEVDVVRPLGRRRKAGHHGGVLPVHSVTPRSLGGDTRQKSGQISLQTFVAIEDHAQAVVVFPEVRVLYDPALRRT